MFWMKSLGKQKIVIWKIKYLKQNKQKWLRKLLHSILIKDKSKQVKVNLPLILHFRLNFGVLKLETFSALEWICSKSDFLSSIWKWTLPWWANQLLTHLIVYESFMFNCIYDEIIHIDPFLFKSTIWCSTKMILKMNRVYMYFMVEVYRVKKKEAAFWAIYKVIVYLLPK